MSVSYYLKVKYMGVVVKRFLIGLTLTALLGAPAFADSEGSSDYAVSQNVFMGPTISPDMSLPWYNVYGIQDDRMSMDIGSAPIETDTFGLVWSKSGRWGLTLDVTRRSDNLLRPEKEIAAGAYYQLTPRFRFGGGVSFSGDDIEEAARLKNKQDEAGVRIESAFSF